MLQSLGWLKGELKKENLGLPWFTFTYIYIHLHTFTYIYIHLHIFTYIIIHYHTFTYIYIHDHTLSYIYRCVYHHVRGFLSIPLKPRQCFGGTLPARGTRVSVRDAGVAKRKWPGSLGAKRFSVAPKLKPTLANSDSHGQQPVDIHL